jgi:hypothetical protein
MCILFFHSVDTRRYTLCSHIALIIPSPFANSPPFIQFALIASHSIYYSFLILIVYSNCHHNSVFTRLIPSPIPIVAVIVIDRPSLCCRCRLVNQLSAAARCAHWAGAAMAKTRFRFSKMTRLALCTRGRPRTLSYSSPPYHIICIPSHPRNHLILAELMFVFTMCVILTVSVAFSVASTFAPLYTCAFSQQRVCMRVCALVRFDSRRMRLTEIMVVLCAPPAGNQWSLCRHQRGSAPHWRLFLFLFVRC